MLCLQTKNFVKIHLRHCLLQELESKITCMHQLKIDVVCLELLIYIAFEDGLRSLRMANSACTLNFILVDMLRLIMKIYSLNWSETHNILTVAIEDIQFNDFKEHSQSTICF